MLIVCPKCFTQYAVSDEISIKKGQKFHCSACQNYFVLPDVKSQVDEDESEVIPTVSAVMQAVNQPAAATIGTQISMPTPTAMNVPTATPASVVSTAPTTIPQNDLSAQSQVYSDSVARPDSEPHFVEPLSLLAHETPNPSDRLDSIPEEFKPVTQQSKKTSFIGTLFWLAVAGTICAVAYMQKDYFIKQVDTFIMTYLDKQSVQPVVEKQPKNTVEKVIEQPLPKDNKPEVNIFPETSATNAGQVEPIAPVEPVVPAGVVAMQPDMAVNQPVNVNVPSLQEMPPLPQPVSTNPQPVVPFENIPAQLDATLTPSLPETAPTETVPVEVETLPTDMPVLPTSVMTETDFSVLGNEGAQLPALTHDDVSSGVGVPAETEQVVREQAVVPEAFASLAENGSLSTAEIARILKIQDVTYSIGLNQANVEHLKIEGNVVNTDLKTLIIPEITAVVYDTEDMVVQRKRVTLKQARIEGNSVQSFSHIIVPAPVSVGRVEVMFDE